MSLGVGRLEGPLHASGRRAALVRRTRYRQQSGRGEAEGKEVVEGIEEVRAVNRKNQQKHHRSGENGGRGADQRVPHIWSCAIHGSVRRYPGMAAPTLPF